MHSHFWVAVRRFSGFPREKLMQLRRDSNAALGACLKALEEANGDLEIAKKIVSRLVGHVAQDANVPTGAEGAIRLEEADADTIYIARLRSLSDFVARSEIFAELSTKILEEYRKAGRNSLEISLLLRSYSSILKEPIIADALEVVKKSPKNIFGVYLHGKLPNGMATVASVVEITGPQVWNPNLRTFANKVACHIAGMSPISTEELRSQNYIFSQDGITTVGSVLSSLDAEVAHFNRISIK